MRVFLFTQIASRCSVLFYYQYFNIWHCANDFGVSLFFLILGDAMNEKRAAWRDDSFVFKCPLMYSQSV